MRSRLVSLLPTIALSASVATVGLTTTPALAASGTANLRTVASSSSALPPGAARETLPAESRASTNTHITNSLNAASGPTSKVFGSGSLNSPLAVTSDGTHLWVANFFGNSVTELNLTP